MAQPDTRPRKPLGGPAYGSIPHLPSSENGGDKTITQGQAEIILDEPRDDKDNIIATLKYDGSCTAVAKINGEIVPLMRAGYPAKGSNFKQHQLFHDWVFNRWYAFNTMLDERERVVGEWMLQAHATKYHIDNSWYLFRPFDLYRDGQRTLFEELEDRCLPPLHTVEVYRTNQGQARMVGRDLAMFDRMNTKCRPYKCHEGIVYRVERNGEVEFMAKYVRHKQDGKYLPGLEGSVTDEPVWNYPPDEI